MARFAEPYKESYIMKPVLNTAEKLLIFLFIWLALPGAAQYDYASEISLRQAVDTAIANNPVLKNVRLQTEYSRLEHKKGPGFDPLEISFHHGNINSSMVDYYMDINQNFGSIPAHIVTLRKSRLIYQRELTGYEISVKQLTAEVKSAYLFYQYQQSVLDLKEKEAGLYQKMAVILDAKLEEDSISPLDLAKISTLFSKVHNNYLNARDDLEIARLKLQQLLSTGTPLRPLYHEPELYEIVKSPDTLRRGHLMYSYYDMSRKVARADENIVKSNYFPEIGAGFFNQQIDGEKGFYGWQLAIAIPLWVPGEQAAVKQAKIASDIAMNEFRYQQRRIETEIEILLYDLNKLFRLVRHYSDEALPNASLYYEAAAAELESPEPELDRFIESVSSAIDIEEAYLATLNDYNQTALQLEIFE